MLHDTNYNKIKVVHDASQLAWFIEKHALPDLERHKINQPLTKKCYEEMLVDLKKHIHKFKEAIIGLAKEGKFQ